MTNAISPNGGVLLSVRSLEKRFATSSGTVRALSDVSFDVRRGSILGIVGESGSGKTTAGRCILRLVEPSGGEAIFDGVDLFKLSEKELRAYRRRLQIIFRIPIPASTRACASETSSARPSTPTASPGAQHVERIAQLAASA